MSAAAAIPDGLEPLGAWDAGPGWADAFVDEKIAWARQNIPRVNDTYRVEFFVTDMPFAIAYRYAVNAEGRKYAIAEYSFVADGEPAREPPVIVPLDELPPAHLLNRDAVA